MSKLDYLNIIDDRTNLKTIYPTKREYLIELDMLAGIFNDRQFNESSVFRKVSEYMNRKIETRV